MYDLLIIGAGPAGITAGIYAKRANLKVAIFEKGAPGGQVLSTAEVDNYPGFKKASGYDIASHMFEHVRSLEVEVKFEEVMKVADLGAYKEVKTTEGTYQTKAVLVASGAIPRKLDVKDEDTFSQKGISWCAICDGPLYKDKEVVVVGGGNSAVEESLFLTSVAKKITVIQNLGHLTADKKAQEQLMKQKNVHFIFNAQVLEFLGNDALEGVKIKVDDQVLVVPAEGVFEYIGLVPVTYFLEGLDITNEQGYIVAKEDMQTKIPGIFGAGDVIVKHIRQIVTATNDGAIAVASILKYLES